MRKGIFHFFGKQKKRKEDREDRSENCYAEQYAAKFIDLKEYPIDFGRIPQHIAIVMDGNGRWAKAKGFPRSVGHRNGVNSVDKVVEACKEVGVRYLSVYAFSTENWKRPKDEVNTLMQLLVEFAHSKLSKISRNNVRVMILGDLAAVPAYAREALSNLMERTKHNTGLTLNLCINYGSRWEILTATQQFARQVQQGERQPEDLNEELFSTYLTTAGMPDPEMMIRTSGEQRLSNFLLWQLAYAELYFTDVFWPDFQERELLTAISWYQHRDRRFGGLK